MSSGPDNVTSTTLSEPPSFLRGPMGQAASQAQRQFTNAMFPVPGQEGAPDLVGQSQNLISQTLNGDFLTPDANPFLEQTFNRAADLTQTRLDSEFAGSGRNLSAAQPARSAELQDLAASIYGGNFQAERDRQITALDQGQGFDPLNRFINQIAGLVPGAGGATQSTQPIFRTGLF